MSLEGGEASSTWRAQPSKNRAGRTTSRIRPSSSWRARRFFPPPFVALSSSGRSLCGLARGLPVPDEQFIQPVVLRRAGHHAFEDVCEVGLGVDAVQFASVEKRRENRPSLTPAFVAAEQAILLSDGYVPDRTLDNVGVRLQPPVLQEQRQTGPAFERVVDRSNQSRLARYAVFRRFEPRLQGLHQRLRLGLPNRAPSVGVEAADSLLDRIDRRDALDDLLGERRVRRLK